MVLVLGNYMNGNTTRGGASGIKISSINKVIIYRVNAQYLSFMSQLNFVAY